MANHGSRVRAHMSRYGIQKVEEFIDHCLSLENLVDPYGPFRGKPPVSSPDLEESETIEVPKLKSKDYMDSFINPA